MASMNAANHFTGLVASGLSGNNGVDSQAGSAAFDWPHYRAHHDIRHLEIYHADWYALYIITAVSFLFKECRHQPKIPPQNAFYYR